MEQTKRLANVMCRITNSPKFAPNALPPQQ